MADERDLSIPSLLFVKVESSGLYRRDLEMHDEGQCYPMEIAGMLCNTAGAVTSTFAHIIRAEGRRPQDKALKIHGISDRAAAQVGVPEPRVLGLLGDLLKTAPPQGLKVVSYTDFDPMVISAAFARFGKKQNGNEHQYDRLWRSRPLIEFVHLQAPWCQQACKLPNDDDSDYRRPTLDEAGEIILGRPARVGLHDALGGLMILKDLYFHFLAAGHFGQEAA